MRTVTKVKLPAHTLAALGVAEVFKTSTVHGGTIGHDYAEAVNDLLKKRHKKADFKSKPLPWGEKVSDAVIKHGDKSYLQVHNPQAALPEYSGVTSIGARVSIPREQIEPYLPKARSSATQHAKGIGQKSQVITRTYCIGSISEINVFPMKGEKGMQRYRLVGAEVITHK